MYCQEIREKGKIMARFIDKDDNIYRFIIEEKHLGTVSICADSFAEALEFLREQYELHDHETQKFFKLQQDSTNFIDEDGNEYLY